MPRNVRNFWVEGYSTDSGVSFGSGPRSATGDLRAVLMQRHEGSVGDARFRIAGEAMGGTLRTWVTAEGSEDGATFALVRRDGTRIPVEPGDALVLTTSR